MIRAIAFLLPLALLAQTAEPLERELARLAKIPNGAVGFAVTHLESGRTAQVNGSQWFYAASTRKIAIAMNTLAMIDEGRERLDRIVQISPSDLAPGSGMLAQLVREPGLALSIRNLLELMMAISDNSATDILLAEGGGPAAVMERMAALGISGVRVDRPTKVSTPQFFGLETMPANPTPALWDQLLAQVPEEKRKAAAARYLLDEQDNAQPAGMTAALVQLAAGKLLKPESTALLIEIMARCQTGPDRIKGILPAGTPVAHKTGSLGTAIVADAGIVTLPGNRGRLAMAAYTKGGAGLVQNEKVIAHLSRAAYDYFNFASGDTLDDALSRVSLPSGVVGATAIHLETGRRSSIRGAEPFPMASTVKVPIAVQLFGLIDEGKMTLTREIRLAASDLHPGSGVLTQLFKRPGVVLSVHNLLELMLLISDNSATDILLREVGGPAAVNARMAKLGIKGIRVDGSTQELILRWRADRDAKFADDPKDTSTPDGMADLLVKLHRGKLLSKRSTDTLLDVMRRCQTGDARLKGILPPGTEVMHKTGTIGGTVDDVGIVVLPEGRGHVAVAAFVKGPGAATSAQRERALAEIARAAHDYFLFTR
ncbi:MAG: class A beta-lactamase [Bryobacteraceae bacterium]|nr:class A beta-lactamase [Bryobacteraceae bacterium]